MRGKVLKKTEEFLQCYGANVKCDPEEGLMKDVTWEEEEFDGLECLMLDFTTGKGWEGEEDLLELRMGLEEFLNVCACLGLEGLEIVWEGEKWRKRGCHGVCIGAIDTKK